MFFPPDSVQNNLYLPICVKNLVFPTWYILQPSAYLFLPLTFIFWLDYVIAHSSMSNLKQFINNLSHWNSFGQFWMVQVSKTCFSRMVHTMSFTRYLPPLSKMCQPWAVRYITCCTVDSVVHMMGFYRAGGAQKLSRPCRTMIFLAGLASYC